MINKYKYIVCILIINAISLGFSQSLQDLQKLKSEYDKFEKDRNDFGVPSNAKMNNVPESNIPTKVTLIPYQQDITIDENNKFFGYNFFSLRDTVPFWENLPTPSNYLLGPGDQLVVSLWGETQVRETYTISRDGTIYDEKVGLLNISGKRIDDARDYLLNQYGRIYATLSGKNPSTYIDVSIGELQSINVNFVGNVNFPGIYPIHPYSNLILGLIQAGGVDTTGSLRTIQIIRENDVVKTIDLYNYFISGDMSSLIQLRDQDVVLVPPRTTYITVDSAITRPGIYESIPGDMVLDIINYASGPSIDASDNVGILSLMPKSKRNNSLYEGKYISFDEAALVPVYSKDKIIIQPLFTENHFVEIIGQVKSPGIYYYYNNMSITDLFKIASGFEDTTYLKSVYLNQGELIRRNPSDRYDEIITFNLNNIINDEAEDILLKNLDKIVIHANYNFYEKENILILGEVKVPGSYPLISDNESLKSALSRAGGLTSKALINGIAIFRNQKYFEMSLPNSPKNNNLISDKNNNSTNVYNKIETKSTNLVETKTKVRVAWENTNIALMPGDSIIVKEKTSNIYISGEVYNPGILEFRNKKSLNYYINAAGGLTDMGNKKGIIVLYPNGVVKPKKWYNNPKIEEGATIIINRKLEREPFNMTQFATNWTSIASSMITVIVLSKQL